MAEHKIKTEIKILIEEGKSIIAQCSHSGLYGSTYVNGSEYELWITRCIDLVETYFQSHHLREKLINASKRAVGNGIEYYYEINSVLQVLLDAKNTPLIQANNQEELICFEKIFISHSSDDKDYVEPLIQLLNDIGILKSRDNIFCSSFEGYNIPIGEKIYDYIKDQFNNSTLVIFILSRNYYNSIACLNEMGATWIKSIKHISILLPDFSFNNVRGAIDPTEISFKFNDRERFNSFKDDIVSWFNLDKIDGSIWERDRKKFLDAIDSLMRRDKYSNSLSRVDIGRIKGLGKNKIEVELRFINEGQLPVEFQELKIRLIDEDGNECLIEVESEVLSQYVIYNSENRREVLTFDIEESDYNWKRNKKWTTDSYSISAI